MIKAHLRKKRRISRHKPTSLLKEKDEPFRISPTYVTVKTHHGPKQMPHAFSVKREQGSQSHQTPIRSLNNADANNEALQTWRAMENILFSVNASCACTKSSWNGRKMRVAFCNQKPLWMYSYRFQCKRALSKDYSNFAVIMQRTSSVLW